MSSLNKQQRVVDPGELTLVLNAAEGRLQFALGRVARASKKSGDAADGQSVLELLAAQDWQAASQGAELLAPALQQMLGNLKLTPAHIGRIAVVNGPGSFTGLRLACVTASALARALGATQAALEYLPLLAAGAVAAGWVGSDFLGGDVIDKGVPNGEADSGAPCQIWVMSYARRGLVYLQEFEAHASVVPSLAGLAPSARPYGGPGKESGGEPDPEISLDARPEQATFLPGLLKSGSLLALGLEEAADRLRGCAPAADCRSLVLGSGLSKNLTVLAPLLRETCPRLQLLPPFFDQPAPELLLRAAFGLSYSHDDVSPLYVRSSDAEENLPQIAARLGLDEDYALARLQELLRS